MGGKKKKCGIVYPFAAETKGLHATSLSFKLCGTESYKGSYKPGEDAASSPPTEVRKNTVICVQE